MKIRDRIFAPWERSFDRLLTPLEDFVEEQTSSSFILLFAALTALFIANSPLREMYFHFIHGIVKFDFLDWSIGKSLHHWVNDGLMALFFFVVGLEIKREIRTGELSQLKYAVTPIAAAIGGMVFPAVIFSLVNTDPAMARGWGVPIATDIAFAVAALMLLGDRIPKSLVAFLVALAIVDDLCGVLIIAIFYTAKIDINFAFAAACFVALLLTLNMSGVRKPLPYFVIGVCLWLALLKSGLHATLAGVITALTIPSRPKYDPEQFTHRFRRLIDLYEETYCKAQSLHRSQRLRSILTAMENGILGTSTPAYRLEHSLHLPVAFVVVPIFAFVNTGIEFDWATLESAARNPMAHGIIAGLCVGKVVGVAGATWLITRLGFGAMPRDTNLKHIVGAGFLAGIGFTMSIFIAELAFKSQNAVIIDAKIGILIASVISGLLGVVCLRFWAPNR